MTKKNDGSDFEISNCIENQSSLENSQCIKKEKKLKLKLKKERIYKQKNHGSWNDEEEKKFVAHMKINRKIFQDKEARRSKKIFRQMAKYVGTRSSEQCRSHHQKYQLRFCNFDSIISHIQSKIEQNIRKFKLNTPPTYDQSCLKQPIPHYMLFNQGNFIIPCPNFMMTDECAVAKGSLWQINKDLHRTQASSEETILDEGQGYKIIRKKERNLQLEVLINLQVFLKD